MADTDDAAAADDGQPIATIANTITGPGPPLMTMDAVAHEGGNSNNDEGTNVSPTTNKAWLSFILIISHLNFFPYRIAMRLRELSKIPRLSRRLVYCKLKVPKHIVSHMQNRLLNAECSSGK